MSDDNTLFIPVNRDDESLAHTTLSCPKQTGQRMRPTTRQELSNLEVDQCPHCKGRNADMQTQQTGL